MLTTSSETKTIRINDWDLHYVEQGMGPALVFIHGGGATDFRTWGPQVDFFSDAYRCVAYSLRYHYPNAWSAGGADYSTRNHADDLAGLIEALELAPAHLVTASYGGEVALAMTRRQPHLVRTLVLGEPPLANWHPELTDGPARSAGKFDNLWQASSWVVKKGQIEQGVRLYADQMLGGDYYDELPESARQRMLENARLLTLPEPSLSTDFSQADAAAIQVPTLLLTGELSPKHFLVVSDELARHLPRVERFTIPSASHFLHVMNPGAYNQAVLAFLGRRPA
jgi:non-heme chloroperoxidase